AFPPPEPPVAEQYIGPVAPDAYADLAGGLAMYKPCSNLLPSLPMNELLLELQLLPAAAAPLPLPLLLPLLLVLELLPAAADPLPLVVVVVLLLLLLLQQSAVEMMRKLGAADITAFQEMTSMDDATLAVVRSALAAAGQAVGQDWTGMRSLITRDLMTKLAAMDPQARGRVGWGSWQGEGAAWAEWQALCAAFRPVIVVEKEVGQLGGLLGDDVRSVATPDGCESVGRGEGESGSRRPNQTRPDISNLKVSRGQRADLALGRIYNHCKATMAMEAASCSPGQGSGWEGVAWHAQDEGAGLRSNAVGRALGRWVDAVRKISAANALRVLLDAKLKRANEQLIRTFEQGEGSNALTELRSYRVPPKYTFLVLQAVLTLAGSSEDDVHNWGRMRVLTNYKLIRRLVELKPVDVTPKVVKIARRVTSDVDEADVRKESNATLALFRWLVNFTGFSELA
ncbi:hypothetical protein QJQ45_027370, partial [Haematococcus lacustris]